MMHLDENFHNNPNSEIVCQLDKAQVGHFNYTWVEAASGNICSPWLGPIIGAASDLSPLPSIGGAGPMRR